MEENNVNNVETTNTNYVGSTYAGTNDSYTEENIGDIYGSTATNYGGTGTSDVYTKSSVGNTYESTNTSGTNTISEDETTYGTTNTSNTNTRSSAKNVYRSIPTNYGSTTVGNNYGSTSDTNTTNTTGNTSTKNTNTSKSSASNVPAKVSIWSKVKQFLCQEITVELTPSQERAFKEVYDFWHQDISVVGTKEFWLRDIEITL